MADRGADYEVRSSPARALVDLDEDRRIRGDAIIFNSMSQVLRHPRIGAFREWIRPDAVERTLRNGFVKALWNHNDDIVLGSSKSGTLSLTKTPKALKIDIDPPKWANHYLETIQRGDVDGMSFGFRVIEDEWETRTDDGIPLREIVDMEFNEVSIVAFQAYLGTTVGLSTRSLAGFDDVMTKARGANWRAQYAEIRRLTNGL